MDLHPTRLSVAECLQQLGICLLLELWVGQVLLYLKLHALALLTILVEIDHDLLLKLRFTPFILLRRRARCFINYILGSLATLCESIGSV